MLRPTPTPAPSIAGRSHFPSPSPLPLSPLLSPPVSRPIGAVKRPNISFLFEPNEANINIVDNQDRLIDSTRRLEPVAKIISLLLLNYRRKFRGGFYIFSCVHLSVDSFLSTYIAELEQFAMVYRSFAPSVFWSWPVKWQMCFDTSSRRCLSTHLFDKNPFRWLIA